LIQRVWRVETTRTFGVSGFEVSLTSAESRLNFISFQKFDELVYLGRRETAQDRFFVSLDENSSVQGVKDQNF